MPNVTLAQDVQLKKVFSRIRTTLEKRKKNGKRKLCCMVNPSKASWAADLCMECIMAHFKPVAMKPKKLK